MEREATNMELIKKIVDRDNIQEAIVRVKSNKGAAGIDGMTVDELDSYFKVHGKETVSAILNKCYKPKPVKRVYIPKPDGGKRPLGIPTVVDRVIQQVIAQILTPIFDRDFSEYNYGFRNKRSQHMAINQSLKYLNEGCEWCIDMDIEKYFDTVNHDRLISMLREKVKDSATVHLVRKFLQSGIMENRLLDNSEEGVPQGGPLSPLLSNIYLDKLDKELESRGLRFVRYADDTNIFVKSEMSANRVIKSISSWIERKLFLKVNAKKTKVVRPMKSNFLGITYYRDSEGWKCRPTEASKNRLYEKCKLVLIRKRAVARSLEDTFKRINSIVRGWINYHRIGSIKKFIDEFGQWLRHKIRVIILKQWKKPKTIRRNLTRINVKYENGFTYEEIGKVSASRKGWYKRANGNVVNFILNQNVLSLKRGNRPGLVNPLKYYLS